MTMEIDKVATRARWKLRALLNLRKSQSAAELLLLYKADILSTLEYRTPAVYHACSTSLAVLDRVQAQLLRELGITAEEALLDFNLAPLETRRDMAMLGLIHKICLGQAPQPLAQFFIRSERPAAVQTREAIADIGFT